jgi:phosphate transport system permease protein
VHCSSTLDTKGKNARRGWQWVGRVSGGLNLGDRVFYLITATFAGLIAVMLGAMAVQMTSASLDSFRQFGWGFILSRQWDPVREEFGALPFIYGTVVSSLLALAIAVPVALGIAIYLSELAPAWLGKIMGFIVELLAAIPSVVYGLWGIFLLAPLLRDHIEPGLVGVLGGSARGFDMFAGGIILSIMILPTIASVSRDVMRATPNTLREGAFALGATRWETITHAVLPNARSGIVSAIVLGRGRALGETMAVTMVIGNRAQISASLLDPAYTMASVIANEYAEATSPIHLAALSELALLLFAITLILNAIARLVVWRVNRSSDGPRRR